MTETIRRFPYLTLACVTLLMGLGLGAIAEGDDLYGGRQLAIRQLLWCCVGLPLIPIIGCLDYRWIRPHAYLLYAITLGLLVAVMFLPPINGSRRWIPLGVINFQPSELAKLSYILSLACYLMYRDHYRGLWALMVPLVLMAIPVLLIVKEPDLGTSLLFLPVTFSMLYASGAKLRHLVLIWLLGASLLPVIWTQMSAEQRSRVTTLFDQRDGGPMPPGDGYHLHQSKQLIAVSSWEGGRNELSLAGDPRLIYLPAARTDFVFCLVAVRWGLKGLALTLLLYGLLIGCAIAIATRTREPFGKLIATGIATLLGAQVCINTAMTVGIAPITGLTLPLMSYGGSSMLSVCLSVGVLTSIALRPGTELLDDPFTLHRVEW